MIAGNKNLTDPSTFLKDTNSPLPFQEMVGVRLDIEKSGLSYTKTNKLISALFMVTDIMDKEEPLRNKLRSLGAGIISDMHNSLYSRTVLASGKITEILSFLDITSAIGMISGMNCNILKKEFIKLKQSIQEFSTQSNPVWLEEFLKEEETLLSPLPSPLLSGEGAGEVSNLKKNSIGHSDKGHSLLAGKYQGHSTRIGVQKGSTLMKALSDKFTHEARPITLEARPNMLGLTSHAKDFNLLKTQRREEIIKIIKDKKDVYPTSGGSTITDIRTSAKGVLVSCGEKTLQRELISMVSDGVLKKIGEKRWSKYFL